MGASCLGHLIMVRNDLVLDAFHIVIQAFDAACRRDGEALNPKRVAMAPAQRSEILRLFDQLASSAWHTRAVQPKMRSAELKARQRGLELVPHASGERQQRRIIDRPHRGGRIDGGDFDVARRQRLYDDVAG